MEPSDWLEELKMLVCRFEGTGIREDLAYLDEGERWGLFCYLRRLAGE